MARSATPSRLIFPRLTRTTSGTELEKSRHKDLIRYVGLLEVVNSIKTCLPHPKKGDLKGFLAFTVSSQDSEDERLFTWRFATTPSFVTGV
jgi:hypothetical protein